MERITGFSVCYLNVFWQFFVSWQQSQENQISFHGIKNIVIFVSMETKSDYTTDEKEYPAIIIGKLMSISGLIQRESNRLLLPYQLNQQQFAILFEIAKTGEVQQKNMVNRMILERSHVSKVVKKLHLMGLVDIIPLTDDKRSAMLKPTAKGTKLVAECRNSFQIWNKEWFEQFNARELNQILESTHMLQKAFMSKYSTQIKDQTSESPL